MPSRNSRQNGDSAKRGLKRLADTESRPLTKREVEVVEWIAAGKRNAEIGKILGCSSRTVQKHVQHILEKLHLETRIAVCIWWYERRLDGEGSISVRQKSVRI
jgi:DNA-binding CsgD family transcriptional regulator